MKKLTFVTFAISILLSACGGGGSDAGVSGGNDTGSGGSPQTNNVPNGGIWSVDTIVNGSHVQGRALITEDGRLMSFSQNLNNGCADIAIGNVSVNGSSVTGTDIVAIVEYATGSTINTNCAFVDGSTWGTQLLNGSIVKGSTLTFSGTTTTGNGTTFSSSAITATFNSLYNRPSSLNKLAGSWLMPTGNFEFIDANGVLNSYDPTTNCTFTGQVSLIDSRYNAYSVTNTPSGCMGAAAIFNGQTARSIMTLDDTVSPNLLYSGGTVTIDGITYIGFAVSQR